MQKTKDFLTFPKHGFLKFWQTANGVLSAGNFIIPPIFHGPEALSSASDKRNFLAKKCSKKSNLYESGVSLPVFSFTAKLILHNASVLPKFIKKVITNLNLSKVSGSDCNPMLALKISES